MEEFLRWWGISGAWLIFFGTLLKVLSVEFIDKSFILAATAAGTRKDRKLLVFLAAYFGIMVNMILTTFLGYMLPVIMGRVNDYGPKIITAVAGVILFFIALHLFGIYKWLPEEEEEVSEESNDKHFFAALMIGVFLAELGDLTQFQVILTAAGFASFFAVLAGAAVAFCITMLCAVIFGVAFLDILKVKVGEESLHRIAGVICLCFSIYFFWTLFS